MFAVSTVFAVNTYLGTSEIAKAYDPEIWQISPEARDYLLWTSIIEKRKGEAARQKRAELEHDQFLKEINNTIKKFKQELAKEKKPKFALPLALAKYDPQDWAELKPPTKAQVEQWAELYVWKRVPHTLKPFVSWDFDWQVQTSPSAKYELDGVPCLTWCFTIMVLVEVRLRMPEQTFWRDFHGYRYEIKLGAEELGRLYLGPVQWGDQQEGFTTPLALLSVLAMEKLEDDGIEVTEQDGSIFEYCIRGYDDSLIEIHERFRGFVIDIAKDKTLAKGLVASGVIDELTAQLVEGKAKLPLPQLAGDEASLGQGSVDNSDVVVALEAMGLKKAKIMEAIEAAHLTPGMPLEKKDKAVLKNMGM